MFKIGLSFKINIQAAIITQSKPNHNQKNIWIRAKCFVFSWSFPSFFSGFFSEGFYLLSRMLGGCWRNILYKYYKYSTYLGILEISRSCLWLDNNLKKKDRDWNLIYKYKETNTKLA